MNEFNQNIFGKHELPFAAYLEPDGFDKLPLKRPTTVSYERCIPRTVEIARAMYSTVPNVFQWGRHTEAGVWITFTHLNQHSRQDGTPYFAYRLAVYDLIKHYCGRTFAVANVDRFVQGQVDWDPSNHKVVPYLPRVRTLRIDVDAPDVYDNHDIHSLGQQISLEKNLVNSIGFPCSVFRTGGRGHQIVIPLPHFLNVSTASCIMHILKRLLKERTVKGFHVCSDNLTGLMRLPGGIHGTSRSLGLWINPETTSLYPLDIQAELMANGLARSLDNSPELLPAEQFKSAIIEIFAQIQANGIDRWKRLQHHEFEALAQSLPDNHFLSFYMNESKSPIISLPAPKAYEAAQNIVSPDDDWAIEEFKEAIVMDTTWAKRYFDAGYLPGNSFEYLLPNGIRAAMILFKTKSRAEKELIKQAKSIIPCPQERIDTIRDLIASFDSNSMSSNMAHLANDYAILMDRVAAAIDESPFKANKKRKLKQLSELLLIEYQKAEQQAAPDDEGYTGLASFEISSRVIEARFQRRWKDESITYKTIQRLLPHLIEGDSSLFGLFKALDVPRHNNKDVYMLGRDARKELKIIRHELQKGIIEELPDYAE